MAFTSSMVNLASPLPDGEVGREMCRVRGFRPHHGSEDPSPAVPRSPSSGRLEAGPVGSTSTSPRWGEVKYTLPPQINFDHPLVCRDLVDRALRDRGSLVQHR